MKCRLFSAILIIILIIGCVGCSPNVDSSAISSPISETISSFNKNEIGSLFGLTKEQLISRLGTEYTISDIESEYNLIEGGYLFENIGLAFCFNENGKVDYIQALENFDINGAKLGMTLDQIKSLLNDLEVEEKALMYPSHLARYYSGDVQYAFSFYTHANETICANIIITQK